MIKCSGNALLGEIWQASRRYVRTACKCHGLSGSCSLRTCFKRVPDFSEVGVRLRAGFDDALRVTVSNDNGRRLHPADYRLYTDEDLVYSQDSPDYCIRNSRVGSLGTRGRQCEPHSMGLDSCDILCCGRGYRTRKVTTAENCRCEFRWCCEVVCQTCTVTKIVHKCR